MLQISWYRMGLCMKLNLQNPHNIRGFKEQVRCHNAPLQTLIETPKRQAGRSNRPGNAKTADFPRIFGGSFFLFAAIE